MKTTPDIDSSILPLHDFLCQDGCGELPTDELILKATQIATESGIKFKVVSGKRCEARNVAIGGAKRSRHIDGRACDVSYSDALRDFLVNNRERLGISVEDPAVTVKGRWLHFDLDKRGGKYVVFVP